ncbi:hypothetical protein DRE_01130 [Drechslerella stenobrocha 248]|uniref:Uncharacterized protein n=1 Tax=Drechslerella stenobrocha 248 TaxID=1043628 RepID=W7HMG3_9PEZI|nr:hypothetical protein DRE_01130 [Drechslerella stenobrocha 248]
MSADTLTSLPCDGDLPRYNAADRDAEQQQSIPPAYGSSPLLPTDSAATANTLLPLAPYDHEAEAPRWHRYAHYLILAFVLLNTVLFTLLVCRVQRTPVFTPRAELMLCACPRWSATGAGCMSVPYSGRDAMFPSGGTARGGLDGQVRVWRECMRRVHAVRDWREWMVWFVLPGNFAIEMVLMGIWWWCLGAGDRGGGSNASVGRYGERGQNDLRGDAGEALLPLSGSRDKKALV